MKILLFLIVISCTIVYPQWKEEIKAIPEYINTVDSIYNKTIKSGVKADPKTLIKDMDINELKHIAKLMFKASDLNHIALLDTISKRTNRNELKSNSFKIKRVDYNYISGNLQNEMKERISPLIYALATIPYFLLIEVHDVKSVIPKEEDVLHSPTTVIDAKIAEVYKGKCRFKKGDVVQFYYYNFWQKENHSFDKGKTYFIPIEPRGTEPITESSPLALVPYLDNATGYYPIVNGYLLDKYNQFGFGKKILLEDFNKKFINKIEEMATW